MPTKKTDKIKELKMLFETISPIVINPSLTSLTVGISKRFFLFDLIQKLTKRIEDDPYLNFISALKHYKVLGKFLNGNLHEFYRDRNKSYFKHFFVDLDTYRAVKQEIEWVYEKNNEVKVTITKRGVIIYDNYKKNSFNLLLLTIHSGELVPKEIQKKQNISAKQKSLIEDTDTNLIYGDLVLKKNGIWINTKQSRFACDFNRPRDRAIYENNSEKWVEKFWKEPLSKKEKEKLLDSYDEFYFALERLIETYRFNIIFDGHSMKDSEDRPDISFGTEHIPNFYMPVVRSMQNKMKRLGCDDVQRNKPFGGGGILQWFKHRFPDVFIFSMEINKRIYMTKDQGKSIDKKVNHLRDVLLQIFDIEDEEDETVIKIEDSVGVFEPQK